MAEENSWSDEVESPATEEVEAHGKGGGHAQPPVPPAPFKSEKNDDDGDDVEAHGSGKAQPPVPPTPF